MNLGVPEWTTLVTPAELAPLLGTPGLRLVDTRFSLADVGQGRQLYLASHLPDAVYADLNADLSDLQRTGHGRHPLPDARAFAARLGQWGIGPSDQVVVYDAGDGSMAAARLWWMLRLLGHRRVAVLDGGLAAWRAAGLPEDTHLPVVAARPAYPGGYDATRIVESSEVLDRLGERPGWLLDARARERFEGKVEPLDPVAGHVPGAVNRPFTANLQDGRFKPVAQLRDELSELLGAQSAQRLVVMCGSGVTACHLLLALEHAGFHGARVHADSWSGWLADPSRPVAHGP